MAEERGNAERVTGEGMHSAKPMNTTKQRGKKEQRHGEREWSEGGGGAEEGGGEDRGTLRYRH